MGKAELRELKNKVGDLSNNQKLLVVTALFLVLATASVYALESQIVKDSTTSGIVGNATEDGNNTRIGVSSGQALDYGEIPVDSNVTRFVNLSVSGKTLFKVSSEGNISEHLEYPEEMYFKGKKKMQVKFTPSELGYYKGIITLNIQQPKSEIGKKWLDIKQKYF